MNRVTTVESTPPDSNEPTGTSDINWRRTAARRPARIASSHSPRDAGTEDGAKRVANGSNRGVVGSALRSRRHR